MTEKDFLAGLELLAMDRRKGAMVGLFRRMGVRRAGKALERALKGVKGGGQRPEGGGQRPDLIGGGQRSDGGGQSAKRGGQSPDLIGGAQPPEKKRLREDFDFLGDDDCPEVLKVLVSDMITTHGRYVKGHGRLFDVAHKSAQVCFKAAEVVVENYIENRRIWAELNHYKNTRTLLGEHPIFERIKQEEALKNMTDAEKKKYKESVRKKIWKRKEMLKNNPDSVHAERWREEIKEFERLKS